ncbi:MAG: alpha/beta hydrolase fold protein [Rhodospirillales bacterium]|nr:alpha/beta hydrolase fold protein [Rhodospirillales bacterium]
MIPASSGTGLPVAVNGIEIEVIRRGAGRPLLFLHPGIGIAPEAPVLDYLAEGVEVIAPSHPGFGHSQLPATMTHIDDLAYFYLDFLETFDLREVIVVGVSFGAWIAAEVAVKSTERISRLVLADAVGVKIGDRTSRDIADIFAMTDTQFAEMAYHDPRVGQRDTTALSEAELLTMARNREATARFGWIPYMHDPKLKDRLHRVRVPTLVLWGESDRIVTPKYGRAFCDALPDARFELIELAGHFPHIEQPETFARRVLSFAGEAGVPVTAVKRASA